MGCDGVGWQGETTLRAYAREEEQRCQRAPAQFNRVCSAFTQMVSVLGRKNISVHAGLPNSESGQLPNLGSNTLRVQGYRDGGQCYLLTKPLLPANLHLGYQWVLS